MTIDLEVDLRQAFAHAADNAPDAIPPWPPRAHRAVVHLIDERAVPRVRVGRLLVGCACAAAVLAALVLVATRDPQREPAAPPYAPPGSEFPLTPTTVRSPARPYAVEPGSAHSMEVAGHPVLTLSVSAWHVNGHVRQYRCLESAGGAGCFPEWNWAAADVGQSSTIDNHVGTFDLWNWANVPSDAEYVLWTDGNNTLWQRPVDGVAVFPVYSDQISRGIAVAVDEAGVEITRAGFGIPRSIAEDPDRGLRSNLGVVASNELAQLTSQTIESCLADPASPGWDECVRRADSTVHARFLELGGELVEPKYQECGEGYTESPTGGCYRTPMAPPTTHG